MILIGPSNQELQMKKIIIGIVGIAFASNAAFAADAAKKCCCDDMKGKAEQPAPKK